MNENFENLLYESGLIAQGCWDELDTYAQEAIIKFGQLIVRDCIRIMHEQERIPKEFFYPKSAQQHELAIRDHFGIKESKREKIDKAMKEAFKDGVDLSGKETP